MSRIAWAPSAPAMHRVPGSARQDRLILLLGLGKVASTVQLLAVLKHPIEIVHSVNSLLENRSCEQR